MLSKKPLLYSLLISLAIALVVEHRVFYDHYAINDDVRNQIYWMARFIDPSYFSNDYIASYFTQPNMISPVIGSLYQFLSHFADPKFATQFLVFPIILLTTFFLYKAAEVHAGSKYGFWIAFVFNLYIWTMKYTAGALPRSYFYLLFFLFLWMLAAKRWNWLVICFVLQALIYPTAFFVSIVTLIIEVFQTKKLQGSFDKAQVQATVIGSLSAFVVFYFRYLRHHISQFGPIPSLVEALKMPEFYIDGRACVFVIPFKLSAELLHGISGMIIYLSLIVALYWIIRRFIINKLSMISTPSYLWTSISASLFLFVLAHFVLFYLYLPHRFITYVLPLIPIFLLGAVLYQLDMKFSSKPIVIWFIAILCLVLIYPRWNDDLIEIPSNEQKLYSFLKTTPRDALIVAPLKLASNIPAFSYRSVLVSHEVNIPFHKDYYREVQARIKALDLIYNSEDNMELISIIHKYNIGYIIIDLKQNTDTALKDIFSKQKVYSTKRFIVLDLSSLESHS